MLIRAALVLDGRAIPLYEAAYPLKHYNKPRTHKRFLMELSTLLPAHCIPIIVTDAGFRGPWFKAVEALGWHWIGRVRNVINYRLLSVKRGVKPQTCTIAPALNPVISAPPNCRLNRPISAISICTKSVSSIKSQPLRHTLRKHGTSETFAEQQRQPWLIATNLSPQLFSPKDMVKLYGKRMQVESSFRDLKSDRFVWFLTHSNNAHRPAEYPATDRCFGYLMSVVAWFTRACKAMASSLPGQHRPTSQRALCNFPWQRSPRAKRLRLQFQRTDPGTSKLLEAIEFAHQLD